MTVCGYARVSTVDQGLEVQLAALQDAGVEKVFAEKQSGTSTQKREQLAEMLDWVREGDVVVVMRLDRLARSVSDLHQIMETLAKKAVGFRCLQQPIDTTTSHGRLMLTILGAFAEFEADIRRDRQMEGIARAKAQGRYKSDPKIMRKDVERLKREENLGAAAIAKRLGCSRRHVYRVAPDLWGAAPDGLRRDA